MASTRSQKSFDFSLLWPLISKCPTKKKRLFGAKRELLTIFENVTNRKGFEIKRPHKSNRGVKENKLIGADYNGFVVIWDGKQVSSKRETLATAAKVEIWLQFHLLCQIEKDFKLAKDH